MSMSAAIDRSGRNWTRYGASKACTTTRSFFIPRRGINPPVRRSRMSAGRASSRFAHDYVQSVGVQEAGNRGHNHGVIGIGETLFLKHDATGLLVV